MMTNDTPTTDTRPQGSTRRWVVIGTAAVVVVVAVAVAVILAFGRSGESTTPATSAAPTETSSMAPPSSTAPATSAAPTEPPSTGERPTAAPVPLDAPATPRDGVTVRLTAIEAVQGEGVPGETSGPALRVVVSVTNDSVAGIDLTPAIVNLFYGDGVAGNPLTGGQAVPFPGSVGVGETVEGAFVFTVPEDQRSAVTVEVDLSTQDSLIVFAGSVS